MEHATAFVKYPFLKDLGLTEKNFGAHVNGKWVGTGAVKQAINPATKEVNQFIYNSFRLLPMFTLPVQLNTNKSLLRWKALNNNG